MFNLNILMIVFTFIGVLFAAYGLVFGLKKHKLMNLFCVIVNGGLFVGYFSGILSLS